jgi:membrane protease YdiL (CAAX protease family)
VRHQFQSPAPPHSRTTLVLGLYAGMALLAIFIAAWRGDPNVFAAGPHHDAIWGPPLGLALGLAVVAFCRVAAAQWQWAQVLNRSFRDVLGPLTGRDIWILAATSSIGEEMLFRGALTPWLGVWLQAAIFALLHIGPGKRFVPWTIFAALLGVALGYLAMATGNLAGVIIAHFVINALNLRQIMRDDNPAMPLLQRA